MSAFTGRALAAAALVTAGCVAVGAPPLAPQRAVGMRASARPAAGASATSSAGPLAASKAGATPVAGGSPTATPMPVNVAATPTSGPTAGGAKAPLLPTALLPPLPAPLAGLIGLDGGSLVVAGGLNLVGNAGNTLVGNGGNSLVGNAGNTFRLAQAAGPCPSPSGLDEPTAANGFALISGLTTSELALRVRIATAWLAAAAERPPGVPFTAERRPLCMLAIPGLPTPAPLVETAMWSPRGEQGGVLMVCDGATFDPAKANLAVEWTSKTAGRMVTKDAPNPILTSRAVLRFDLERGEAMGRSLQRYVQPVAKVSHVRHAFVAAPGRPFEYRLVSATRAPETPCEESGFSALGRFSPDGASAFRYAVTLPATPGLWFVSPAGPSGREAGPAAAYYFDAGTDEVPGACGALKTFRPLAGEATPPLAALLPAGAELAEPTSAEVEAAENDPDFGFPDPPSVGM